MRFFNLLLVFIFTIFFLSPAPNAKLGFVGIGVSNIENSTIPILRFFLLVLNEQETPTI